MKIKKENNLAKIKDCSLRQRVSGNPDRNQDLYDTVITCMSAMRKKIITIR